MRDHSGDSKTQRISHVGFLNSNKVWGGGEKWHKSIAFIMKERNIRVTLFAQYGSELFNRAHKEGIHTVGVSVTNMSFLNPVKIIRLAMMFRKLQIGAVILNLPSDVKLGGIAARLAGIKKIIYRRGSPVPVKNSLVNRFLFRHILTHIIANSDQVKKNILLHNPNLVRENKISVIYNGIDGGLKVPIHSPGSREEGTHGIVIGSAGRLSREKGQKWLVNMASVLKNKGLDFTLLIAGEGPLKDTLMGRSRDLNLSDCVRFLGFVVDMDNFYRNIDLFVLTSAWEGCPNVILEAMHQGLPLVAFNNSSLPEIVIDNYNGFLVKNEDERDLAEKVEVLIRDSSLRKKFGEAGRQIVYEKYKLFESYDQLTALINK